MRFYPDLPARRLRSLVRDLLVLAALAEVGLSRSEQARPGRSRGALERVSRN